MTDLAEHAVLTGDSACASIPLRDGYRFIGYAPESQTYFKESNWILKIKNSQSSDRAQSRNCLSWQRRVWKPWNAYFPLRKTFHALSLISLRMPLPVSMANPFELRTFYDKQIRSPKSKDRTANNQFGRQPFSQ
jgi:hypothetical protein